MVEQNLIAVIFFILFEYCNVQDLLKVGFPDSYLVYHKHRAPFLGEANSGFFKCTACPILGGDNKGIVKIRWRLKISFPPKHVTNNNKIW